MEIVFVVVGILVGAAIGWLIARQSKESDSEEVGAELIKTKALLEAKDTALEETKKQMLDSYKIAATEAFKSAVKEADEQKESAFKGATKALSESMSDYMKAIQDAEKADIKRAATLGQKVDNVAALGTALSEDTRELTLALRGDSRAQGAWGEVVVENLLQSMGFVEDRDYIKQLSETSEDGTRKRTDFVLNLPDNRQVVLDSKVSLTAYTEYVNAENDEDATSAMKAHCKSIRDHAAGLASKNYEHMESIHTLDFVLMVVPLEGAFIDAMRADPSLYEDLVKNRRIKIVSGTSLMLTLMLIQELWNRERQTKNQAELVNRAGELHDKVVLFLESFTQIGFEIGQASDAYKVASGRLTTGPGNVIRQTEMLKELGAKTKKELREKSGIRALAEEAEEEE
ncbi:MAG: DNA recombination protein RmuC [Candidatus Thermoplasmatota archaeon]|nr:DNA recombination protein RmuC [Candidatus Thermoplasmatota archaeon]MEC9478072.1 DNA recombination protein RmuC [Candidatus Thermoplasmatota archaeon]MED6312937.1 DNA recombination protein RmuC [Candidatus Thermoplasmatota archaeon]MEE3201509.1 DNA recombination protein RmuC [Candidatus Thermoplasmatota archaeon]